MEPQIRYAPTSDGLKIAYYALGSGPTLIVPPPWFAQAIEPEWQIPFMRSTAETASQLLRYVRYDPRGVGLSDPHPGEFTIDALLLDIDAVADAVSPDEPVVLWAPGKLGVVAIAFAARRPERISKLVLWSSGAVGAQLMVEPINRLTELAMLDWDLLMETTAQAMTNFESPEVARDFAAMSRTIPPAGRDAFVRFERALAGWDVTDLLPRVRCPTLVMHPKDSPYMPVANSRRLAAGIEGARLQLIDTSSTLANHPDVLRVTGEFLFDSQPLSRARSSTSTVVVLFADIVNSTGLTEQWGDEVFRQRAQQLDSALRAAIQRCNGRAVEGRTLGDGVLATFLSANDALAGARRCARAGDGAGLPLHVGLHAGDVIRDAGNVFGGTVNVAARVAALSAPSEILVSQTVRDLARTSSDVTFDDRGVHDLKGVSEPVRVFAVRGGGGAEAAQ